MGNSAGGGRHRVLVQVLGVRPHLGHGGHLLRVPGLAVVGGVHGGHLPFLAPLPADGAVAKGGRPGHAARVVPAPPPASRHMWSEQWPKDINAEAESIDAVGATLAAVDAAWMSKSRKQQGRQQMHDRRQSPYRSMPLQGLDQ